MSTVTSGQDVGDRSTTARHAQVVPALVVAELRRPLDGWSGPVLPMELLRWERKADLSEGARAHLRVMIVRRLRSRAEKLWGASGSVSSFHGTDGAKAAFHRPGTEVDSQPVAAGVCQNEDPRGQPVGYRTDHEVGRSALHRFELLRGRRPWVHAAYRPPSNVNEQLTTSV